MTSSGVAPYAALWPRSPRQTTVKSLAKRLDTLQGKTIAWAKNSYGNWINNSRRSPTVGEYEGNIPSN